MLSKEQVLDAVKNGRKSECESIDSRDYSRLVNFFEPEHWDAFGFKLNDDAKLEDITVKEWTRENILQQLRADVEFGFEKALDQRGISSSLMYEVVKMWMWVMEDELQHHDDYPMYGLPLFKAVAIKYGFDNPIGDDRGDESRYGEY